MENSRCVRSRLRDASVQIRCACQAQAASCIHYCTRARRVSVWYALTIPHTINNTIHSPVAHPWCRIKGCALLPNPITPSLNFATATATALYSNPTQQSTTLHDRQHGSSRLRLHPGAHRCRGGLQARLSGARHRAGATSGWSSTAEHGIVTRRSKQCACPANAYSNKL